MVFECAARFRVTIYMKTYSQLRHCHRVLHVTTALYLPVLLGRMHVQLAAQYVLTSEYFQCPNIRPFYRRIAPLPPVNIRCLQCPVVYIQFVGKFTPLSPVPMRYLSSVVRIQNGPLKANEPSSIQVLAVSELYINYRICATSRR